MPLNKNSDQTNAFGKNNNKKVGGQGKAINSLNLDLELSIKLRLLIFQWCREK